MHNGWTDQTTLYAYHFEADGNKLTQAGLMHLRWILENAPEERRVIFVQSANASIESQQRLANVQHAASEMAGRSGCAFDNVKSYTRLWASGTRGRYEIPGLCRFHSSSSNSIYSRRRYGCKWGELNPARFLFDFKAISYSS